MQKKCKPDEGWACGGVGDQPGGGGQGDDKEDQTQPTSQTTQLQPAQPLFQNIVCEYQSTLMTAQWSINEQKSCKRNISSLAKKHIHNIERV